MRRHLFLQELHDSLRGIFFNLLHVADGEDLQRDADGSAGSVTLLLHASTTLASMTAATLITFRETLEASLVVGIVLAFLARTNQRSFNLYVWLGVLVGILASVVLALFFHLAFGGFTGRAEDIYEGVTMLIAAGLISWMILWMLQKRRTIKSEIEQDVQTHIEADRPLGIFLLVLVATAREGVESVIFLNAAIVHTGLGLQLLGSALGIALAVTCAFLLFQGIKHVPLRSFFTATSLLLILFAAGLVAHGVHELQEAALLPFFATPLFDINHILPEKAAFGSLLKSLFGYNANPSLLEVVSHVVYLLGISVFWKWISMQDLPSRVHSQ